jgi:serine/threonine protein kinase/Flp pilus assembly protein TadD
MSEEEVFHQALARGGPGERAAFLDRACAGDPALRASVEALLRAHAGASGFLDPPAAAPAVTVDEPPGGERPGAVIGPYKLLQQIGEGGMGTVFMAEQTRPVKRQVALKIVKAGMDSAQVLARFEAERQALALMDHPNIARVLDAGATPAGRPYFVMELVKGVPITQHCDDHGLTPRERLELFVPVCHAVQHAHQKGVIHRDLKPSNVLVALYDDKPVPKVIDFGVAKAAAQSLTERTMFTQFGQLVGTLEYMSPEQASFNALDVDTRSDVYALGVLLYELLTGTTPFAKKRLREAAFDEVLRIIREEEPPRPSARLSTAEGLPSIAARRRTEPARLSRLVRGDLDWIVMKCLEKERPRRYETANGLARDIENYLRDDPVQASPPGARYRLRKLARRHKRALFAAGVVLTALVLATAVSTWQAARAMKAQALAQERLEKEKEARRQAAANFQKARAAVDRSFTLVSESDLFDVMGLQPLRKQLLEGALQYYREFVDQEPDDAKLQAELGAAYFRLWEIYSIVDQEPDALAALRRALDITDRLRREYPGDTEVLRTLATFKPGGGAFHWSDCPDSLREEMETLQRAAKIWAGLASENPGIPEFQGKLAQVYDQIANMYRDSPPGDRQAALRTGQQAFEIWEKLSREHPKLLGLREMPYRRGWLGLLLAYNGRLPEAEKLIQEAIDFAQKQVTQFPRERRHRDQLAYHQRRMAELFSFHSFQPKKAEQPWQRAISLYASLVADYPGSPYYRWYLGDCHIQFGDLLRAIGRRQEAEESHGEALKLFDKLMADYPDSAGYFTWACRCRVSLARLCVDTGRRQEAEKTYRQALGVAGRVMKQFPMKGYEVLWAYTEFAGFLQNEGRFEEAARLYEEVVNILESLVADHPKEPIYRSQLAALLAAHGDLLKDLGRTPEAEQAFRRSVALGEKAVQDYGKNIEIDYKNAVAHNNLGRLLATCADPKARRPSEAVALAKKAVELEPKQGMWWNTLGVAHYRTADWKASIAALDKSMELRQGGDSFDWFFLAMAHWQLGEKDKARAWDDKAVQWMDKNQPKNEELRRFRAEAAELLGLNAKK